ncbi:MAG: MFS transporter [Syntrophales bacterium]|jgi:nitrate/nitrite transporter NarK|nr:MFS transporter [Syntrophales bacterium]
MNDSSLSFSEPLQLRRWFIFAVGALNFFLSQLYRTSNAVLAPSLIADLSLDSNEIGLISAAFFYAFALTQIPIMLLIDKTGPRKLMTFFSVIGVIGAIVFSLSQGLMSALAGRILLGIGMSCAFMGSLKLLSDWFPPLIFASLAGILTATGTLGNMMSATPLAMMAESYGWRQSFMAIAAFNALLTIALYVILQDKPPAGSNVHGANSSPDAPSPFSSVLHLLRSKDYWFISIGSFIRYGTFAALQALWAGPLLLVVLKYSTFQSGNIILAMNIGTLAGLPFWGIISDRLLHTRKWLVVSGLFLLAATTLLLSQVRTGAPAAATGLIFFFFGFFTASGQLMYTQIKELFPATMTGAALTGINFFTMTGPAFFLQMIGFIMQIIYPTASFSQAAFSVSLYFCFFCQLLAGLIYLMTKEKKLPKQHPDG